MPGMKKAIFSQRLVIFNETLAPVGGAINGKSVGFLLHEAISGRSAEDVASAFITFFRCLEDVKDALLWLDNCSVKGKNRWIYTALIAQVDRWNRNFNYYFEVF